MSEPCRCGCGRTPDQVRWLEAQLERLLKFAANECALCDCSAAVVTEDGTFLCEDHRV